MQETSEWVFEQEDSASYTYELFSSADTSLLQSGEYDKSCDLEFYLQRDDSSSPSWFRYLDLDTNIVQTQTLRGGYQDHQRFELETCTRMKCYRSKWSSFPWVEKDLILLKVHFSPKSGAQAHRNGWYRNRYTFKGTHYYAAKSNNHQFFCIIALEIRYKMNILDCFPTDKSHKILWSGFIFAYLQFFM